MFEDLDDNESEYCDTIMEIQNQILNNDTKK